MLLLAALAFALTLVADAWTTRVGMKRGLAEMNGISVALFGSRFIRWALVAHAAYLAFAVWAALNAQPPAHSIAVWSLFALAALHGVAAVRNYRKTKERA
jgi:hypothetical protein